MVGAVRSVVIGGNKALHDESEDFIKSKLDEYLPRACLYGNSGVYSIATETKEVRDYDLFKLLGFESFEEYCTTKLNATAAWYNGMIDFVDASKSKSNLTVDAYKSIAELANNTPVLNANGRPVNFDKTENVKVNNQGGNSAEYRIAKLKRDHPEIARRLMDGEFKNVADAERAAGIGQAKLTKVQKVQRAYEHLDCFEKDEFNFLATQGEPEEKDHIEIAKEAILNLEELEFVVLANWMREQSWI